MLQFNAKFMLYPNTTQNSSFAFDITLFYFLILLGFFLKLLFEKLTVITFSVRTESIFLLDTFLIETKYFG